MVPGLEVLSVYFFKSPRLDQTHCFEVFKVIFLKSLQARVDDARHCWLEHLKEWTTRVLSVDFFQKSQRRRVDDARHWLEPN